MGISDDDMETIVWVVGLHLAYWMLWLVAYVMAYYHDKNEEHKPILNGNTKQPLILSDSFFCYKNYTTSMVHALSAITLSSIALYKYGLRMIDPMYYFEMII